MMGDHARLLQAHYTGTCGARDEATDLGERILACLQASGKDLDHLTLDDLAPIDHFHTGGLNATRTLLELAGIQAGMHVLDVGGGLGGPARLLASAAGCHVTVLDLTEAYCRAGAILTQRLGLADQVDFRQGDACAMPFEPRSFDVVWLQNMSMNIEDKVGLFREVHRVLRKDGRLALQDIMAGPVQPIHFPVPWAREPGWNFLWPPEWMRELLRDLGLQERAWVEMPPPRSGDGATPAPAAPAPSLSYQVLLGEDYPEMARNSVRNRAEHRTKMIQAVLARA